MSGFNTRLAAGLAGLGILSSAALPAAAGQADVPRLAVHYEDLNLNTAQGAERLYARIESAAAQVCVGPDTFILTLYMAKVRCRREAVARAVNSVGSPRLAAIYAARMRQGVHSPV